MITNSVADPRGVICLVVASFLPVPPNRWTGLVFYHSRNDMVNQVLSVGLVCVNCVFFVAGLCIFWTEFAKEQDISVHSVAKALRASKMSAIADQLRRTASGRTLTAPAAPRGSLFDEGGSTVRSNPLVVEQHNRQQIANRSLVGRSSVFQHRAREANRLENGTRFGDLQKTREQLKRLAQYNTLKQKKGEQKRNTSRSVWWGVG